MLGWACRGGDGVEEGGKTLLSLLRSMWQGVSEQDAQAM